MQYSRSWSWSIGGCVMSAIDEALKGKVLHKNKTQKPKRRMERKNKKQSRKKKSPRYKVRAHY